MNPVLFFHQLQRNFQIPKGDQKRSPFCFQAIQRIRDSSGILTLQPFVTPFERALQRMAHIGTFIRGQTDVGQKPFKFLVLKSEMAIKQVRGILKLSPLQNFKCLFAILRQLLHDSTNTKRFGVYQLSQRGEIDLRDFFVVVLEIAQTGEKQSLNAQTIRSQLQSDKFSVTKLAFFIGYSHLSNGVPSRNNGRATADQGLKVVDEVSPSITGVTTYATRKAKNDRQDDRHPERKPNTDKHTSFVEIRHQFPLSPFADCKRSHFSRQLQSQSMRLAA